MSILYTLEELLSWIKQSWTEEQRGQVEVVTIDMWDGYFYAALEVFPNAVIVIDRFHVEKKAAGSDQQTAPPDESVLYQGKNNES